MADWYNLVEEPWIDLVVKDSRENVRVGIEELLLNAHLYSEIFGKTPLLTFGLYRFFTTLISDIFNITSVSQIRDLLAQGQFKRASIEDYFKEWGDEFYLFSNDTPFLQNNKLEYLKFSSPARLLHNVPSGSNHLLFYPEDRYETQHSFCPPLCAQALAALAPFAIGFGNSHVNPDTKRMVRYTSSINKSPPWYFIVKPTGGTLFEVLLINCCGKEFKENSGTGEVFWKHNRDNLNFHRRAEEVSTLEGMMWLPRQVYLHYEKQGKCTYCGEEHDFMVRRIKFCQGWKVMNKFSWRDPHALYFKRSKRAKLYNTVKPRVHTPAYHILYSVLFPTLFYEGGYRLPVGITQLRELGFTKRGFEIKGFGISTGAGRAAKFIEFSEKHIRIPGKIYTNERKWKLVSEAVASIEYACQIISDLLYFILTNSMMKDNTIKIIRHNLKLLLLSRVKGEFSRFLYQLKTSVNGAETSEIHLGELRAKLAQIIESVIEEYIRYDNGVVLKKNLGSIRSLRIQTLKLLGSPRSRGLEKNISKKIK